MGMVSADGDPSGFTFCCRAGVVTPTGDNWEGGSIEWNSSQTINPNLIVMGSVSHNAVLYAVDPCTGAGDANVNGNGFLSVPAIDGHTYSDPIVGAVQGDGSILLALLASDSLKADLVGWSYPVMPNAWQTPTAPGDDHRSSRGRARWRKPTGAAAAGRRTARSSSTQKQRRTSKCCSHLRATRGRGSPWGCRAFSCGTGVGVNLPNVANDTQAEATTSLTSLRLTVGTVTQQSAARFPPAT